MDEHNGNWLARRPWILIILSFALLVGALAVMLTIAFKTYPGVVEPVSPADAAQGAELPVREDPVVNRP